MYAARAKNRVYSAKDRVYPAGNRVYPADIEFIRRALRFSLVQLGLLSSLSGINRVYLAPNRVYPACEGIRRTGRVYTAGGVSLSGVFGIHVFPWQVATNIKIYKNLQQSSVLF